MYSSGTSSIRNFVKGCVLSATFWVAVLHGGKASGDILVKQGESIAFLGDSITQEGWDYPYGYVRLVMQGLEAQGLKVTPIPAGVSGDTSARMLSRTDGVLSKKPTWMTLSCGFNDMSPYCSWPVSIED